MMVEVTAMRGYDYQDAWTGLGNEQSPHYLNMAKTFIQANPGTPVGSPGRYQVPCETYCISTTYFWDVRYNFAFNMKNRKLLSLLLGVQHRRGSVPPGTNESEFGLCQGGGCEEDARALPQEVPHARHCRWPGENFFRNLENLLRIGWLYLGGKDQISSIFFHAISIYRLTRWGRWVPTIKKLIVVVQGYKTAEWASVWEQYRNCTEKPKIIHKNGSFWNASWWYLHRWNVQKNQKLSIVMDLFGTRVMLSR